MRRSLAALGASAIALLCIAPAVQAAESIPEGSWQGSALDAGPTNIGVSTYVVSGAFQHVFERQVEVTISASPAGGGGCGVASTELPRANAPRAFRVTLTIPCNGVYTLIAAAETTDDSAVLAHESARLDRSVSVAAPAPTVTGVRATADGRSVVVGWDDMVGHAPDLSGYVVQRKIGEGSFSDLASVDASRASYRDVDLPAEGGQAIYRIFATRPSPNGDKTSAASDEAGTRFVSGTTQGDAGSSGSGGSTGGTTGTGASGPGAANGSGSTAAGGSTASGSSSGGGSRGGVRAPSIFSGTFLPPLLRPASQIIGSTTPTTLDTGFDDSLPYERGEPGEQDPVLPNDAMASILTQSQPGRGMAIPMATALVLAIWAIHLRMLARAARPLD